MKTWRMILVVLALTSGATAAPGARDARAQAKETLRLTLDDALRIAEGSNPGYRRATNEALLNGVEMRTTWLERLLPVASLQLYTNFTGNLQRQGTDNYGNPIAKPDADWVYVSRTGQALNLAWSVQGPSLFQAHRRQSLVNERRDLAQRGALTDVQVQVKLLYMDALEQRQLMESEAELLAARRIDLDVVERLFSLVLKTRVDVLNAELAVQEQALALQQQQATYQMAILELQTALGTDDERAVELVDEELPIFDPSGLNAGAMVDRALDVNPRLRESGVAVETARLGLSEQRSAWWPEVRMGFDVYRRSQTTAGGALFDPSSDRGLESNFFLQFSVPLFNDFFGSRQSAQRAAITLRNEQETDRESRLDVEKTVRGAVLSLGNQWETLRLVQRSSEIAREALRLAREEYRLSTLTFEALRASFDSEANTRRQVITARHAFVEALLRLEEAVGGPIRPAATPVAATPVPETPSRN